MSPNRPHRGMKYRHYQRNWSVTRYDWSRYWWTSPRTPSSSALKGLSKYWRATMPRNSFSRYMWLMMVTELMWMRKKNCLVYSVVLTEPREITSKESAWALPSVNVSSTTMMAPSNATLPEKIKVLRSFSPWKWGRKSLSTNSLTEMPHR